MRKCWFPFLVLAFVSGLGLIEAQACGDKFLVVGRGIRYQRVHVAAHPSSILLYMNPASHMPAAAKDIKLESGLKEAGHNVQTIADAVQLQNVLKSARYDLVIADIVDSPAIEQQVESQSSRPVVVPLLYRPTADELAAAHKRYGCAMKTPTNDYFSAIDEAMSQKLHGTVGKTGKTK